MNSTEVCYDNTFKQERDLELCKKVLEVVATARFTGEVLTFSTLADGSGMENRTLERLSEEYPQMEYVISRHTTQIDFPTLVMRSKAAVAALKAESKRITMKSVAHYVYEGRFHSSRLFKAELEEYPWLKRFVEEASLRAPK